MQSVYIHIPFCNHICSYCDFCKIYYHKKYSTRYLESLKQEIKENYQHDLIDTIYIGGGTPTSLDEEELINLLEITKIFHLNNDYEFTVECNVESITALKLQILFSYGVNRLSFGVQTFNPELLQKLNRKHTKEDVFRVISLAKQIGFTNISIDLIYGIENEKIIDLESDLTNYLKLDINHLSLYSLIIENNTMLKYQKTKNIDEDLEYNMYLKAQEILIKNNYEQYEISNYAKVGYSSKHNLNYWNNGNYYGFGLGAVGLQNNYYTYNTKNINKYLLGNFQLRKELITKEVKMSNEMILGLRKAKGVSVSLFKDKYNKDLLKMYNIKNLLQENKLIYDGKYLKINPDYIYLSNDILIKFI